MTKEYIETPTIGEIIREEFLEPLDITPYRLSKELKVSTSTILDLLHKLLLRWLYVFQNISGTPINFG
jgi:plasmid maintenance system antidote protein VapI